MGNQDRDNEDEKSETDSKKVLHYLLMAEDLKIEAEKGGQVSRDERFRKLRSFLLERVKWDEILQEHFPKNCGEEGRRYLEEGTLPEDPVKLLDGILRSMDELFVW